MEVFVGSEALREGVLTRHELRTHYLRVFPDVYAARFAGLTLDDRTRAAWLGSHREGVIAGLASALHGAKWVKDDAAIELNWPNHRAPAGILTRKDSPLDNEVTRIRGMAVTVRRLAEFHRRNRGLRRLDKVLDLVDAGAESPQETRLRLLLMREFPRPATQIPVMSPGGFPRYYLDMGWEDIKVAVEYDGEHHRTDDVSYRKDLARIEYIQSLEWIVIRVVAGNQPKQILARVRAARASRL
ncbi:hypothetical protein [Mycobacterium sp. SMC-4]|uniref:hypothetical protein n=1 Tax=Mycobacterium sp. SMC-4 TaxID=2857059 RepID=UPI0021B2B6CB|nr:hypothetical protein [Mycobacterium sp. SMC-4]UXA19303.1 hypothetical protein KXD98_06700 [Mycobacterium sp. SMC-4]